MPRTDPMTLDKFAVHYGDDTDDDSRLGSLTEEGPLMVAQDHLAAILLPDVVDKVSAAPRYVVSQLS